MMKKITIIMGLLVMNVLAEPTVDIPKEEKAEVKKEFTIQETTSKLTLLLTSAFEALSSVKDEETLKASGEKMDVIAKKLLAMEEQIEATTKPDDKQMKDAAVVFVRMTEEVTKYMQAYKASNVPAELDKVNEKNYMDFLDEIEPMKGKMDALFPPQKLQRYVKEIKAEEAEKAEKAKKSEAEAP